MLLFEVLRYTFYAFDFVFGVLAWGLTSDKLKGNGICLLADSTARSLTTPTCSVVIAFGVILTIILLVVVVLRTLDLFGKIFFPRLVEFFLFLFMALIWLILAIVMVSVTNSLVRNISRVRGAIAGAWIAFFTHCFSAVIAMVAQKKEEGSESSKE